MAQAVKVGIFAVICLVVMAVLIWNIEEINPFAAKQRTVDAVFDSVAGLDEKATVRVAGVRVGQVESLGLGPNGRNARVTIRLERPLDLRAGTIARVANLGLLGEKYVEIIPGPAGGPPLPDNAVLPGVTPVSIDDAMAKLGDIGRSIERATGSFANVDLGGSIDRLVKDLELTSREIRLLVAENRATVNSTLANFDRTSEVLARELPRLADQMNRTLSQIEGILAENRSNVSGSTENIRELTSDLQTSVDNLNQISGKIASGEGTIGKLVNSEEAHQELVATLDTIQGGVETLSGTLGAINRFKIDLDMQGAYMPGVDGDQEGNGSSRTQLLVDIDPQDEFRLYRAGVVNTPQGKRRDKSQEVIITLPDGTTQRTTTQTITRERSYQLSALFGYRTPQDLRIWAGLIESSGGAQVEYPLPVLDKRLWLSFEAFDFNRPNDEAPHLRFTGRYQLNPNLYVIGGYDDFLESEYGSLFLGGGIRWNDDNIKYLLGAVPSF
jgi:phospholipid/cholesterol/gamma-HCH transport system substrate-binding protein